MKLEVGMYARRDDGTIFKISQLDMELCDDKTTINCEKASHNIIDLIEVGDYVNGNKVSYIDDLTGAMRQFNYDYENEAKDCGHWQEEIKTILTKEQFENNCYKIGDE